MTRFRRRTRSRCSCPTCAASWSPAASPACCTPSGEPATSSAPRDLGARVRALAPVRNVSERVSATFDRLPIRPRLAGVSALLTFVILCAFALAIGSLTVERIRNHFNREVLHTANQLPSQLRITVYPFEVRTPLSDFTGDHAVIRVLTLGGAVLAQSPAQAPHFG